VITTGTAIQFLLCIKKEIEAMEKVRKRGAKILPVLKHPAYKVHLNACKILYVTDEL